MKQNPEEEIAVDLALFIEELEILPPAADEKKHRDSIENEYLSEDESVWEPVEGGEVARVRIDLTPEPQEVPGRRRKCAGSAQAQAGARAVQHPPPRDSRRATA